MSRVQEQRKSTTYWEEIRDLQVWTAIDITCASLATIFDADGWHPCWTILD